MLTWLRSVRESALKRSRLQRWLRHPTVEARVREVFALDASKLRTAAADPRSLPSNPAFRASGWSDHMLLRYFLAMDRAQGKRVLDSCSGLGWGSYLVASVAAEVHGVDLDSESVGFSRQQWSSPNLEYSVASVLALPFPDQSFDIVLCMEAIEHFTREDARRYLSELRRVCRKGGHIVGSSAFPETRAEADRLCSKNEHHLYVHTRTEAKQLLSEFFSAPELLTSHYFAARLP